MANLPHLVGSGFVALGLQVQNFGVVFTGEYMMAAADALLESQVEQQMNRTGFAGGSSS